MNLYKRSEYFWKKKSVNTLHPEWRVYLHCSSLSRSTFWLHRMPSPGFILLLLYIIACGVLMHVHDRWPATKSLHCIGGSNSAGPTSLLSFVESCRQGQSRMHACIDGSHTSSSQTVGCTSVYEWAHCTRVYATCTHDQKTIFLKHSTHIQTCTYTHLYNHTLTLHPYDHIRENELHVLKLTKLPQTPRYRQKCRLLWK